MRKRITQPEKNKLHRQTRKLNKLIKNTRGKAKAKHFLCLISTSPCRRWVGGSKAEPAL